MSKKFILSVRLEYNLKTLLTKLADEYKVTVSGLVTLMIQNSFLDEKMSKKLRSELNVLLVRTKRTKLCNRAYIIKNMYNRIMDLSMSSYFTTGDVNMKVINDVVDSFIEEFESYDKKEQNRIKVEFAIAVRQLRKKDYIISNSKNFKMIQYVTRK